MFKSIRLGKLLVLEYFVCEIPLKISMAYRIIDHLDPPGNHVDVGVGNKGLGLCGKQYL